MQKGFDEEVSEQTGGVFGLTAPFKPCKDEPSPDWIRSTTGVRRPRKVSPEREVHKRLRTVGAHGPVTYKSRSKLYCYSDGRYQALAENEWGAWYMKLHIPFVT